MKFFTFSENRNVHFYFDFFAFDFTEIVALHQNYLFLVFVNAFESLSVFLVTLSVLIFCGTKIHFICFL